MAKGQMAYRGFGQSALKQKFAFEWINGGTQARPKVHRTFVALQGLEMMKYEVRCTRYDVRGTNAGCLFEYLSS